MTTIKVGESGSIPIIDFAPFLDGSNKQVVGDAVLTSLKDIGFVYLVNHGLSLDATNGMFEMSKRFFSQPIETKQLAPHPTSGSHHRGYSSPGLEKVYHMKETLDGAEIQSHRAKAPDVKESFEVGREDDEASPNIWLPNGVLSGFKETCLDYYWTCNKIKFDILSAIAVGLRLPEDYFHQYHQDADNQLRLLHYPSVSNEALEKNEVIRIGAHSDFCSLTILIQDDVGGLEVEDPQKPGKFRPATPVKNSIIVNAGDFLMRWSNDLIKSTIHRVRAPPNMVNTAGMTPERYSLVYFCAADLNKVVECIPGTYSDDNPRKYEPISSLEYIMTRLAANY